MISTLKSNTVKGLQDLWVIDLQDLIYNFNIEKQYSKRFTRPDFIDINGSVHVMGVRGGWAWCVARPDNWFFQHWKAWYVSNTLTIDIPERAVRFARPDIWFPVTRQTWPEALNCYRSQGEGILKGGKKRKDELAKYIYCGLFNVQNLNDGSHYKTGSSGQTQALGR